MRTSAQFAASGLLLLAALRCAGQNLPPTSPTGVAARTTPVATLLVTGHRHPAEVQFSRGRLSIVANNAPLSQVLEQVAQATGLRIVGGVASQRVYGSYGPADTVAVLSHLLEGSGTNMLLREDSAHAPRELILSARNGGPTPPGGHSTSEAQSDSEDLPPPILSHAQTAEFGHSPAEGEAQTNPAAAALERTATPAGGTSEGAPGSVTPARQSPNGVKTPQQIYEQLLELLQAQKAAAAPK